MSEPRIPRRPIIVIAGPTASGKSDVAMHLARLMSIEIVCADARTIYRGLSIGTAKPSVHDRELVKHHCLDIADPKDPFSASVYAEVARAAIDAIPDELVPVVVGGSGFYIQALIDGLSRENSDVDARVRESLSREFEERGRDAMYEELVTVDPRAAELYADKNPRRVQRALEYYRTTGSRLSEMWNTPRDVSQYDALFVAIDRDRNDLRQRIEQRCQMMWDLGLLQETQTLLNSGISESAQSLQTVGYTQAIDVLAGRSSLQKAQSEMVTATWQYAKRQLTWLRRDDRYTWISGTTERCALDILQLHQERKSVERT